MNANTTKAVRVKAAHIRKEWNEGHPNEGGDGYWIALKPGWKWAGDAVGAVHSIHENSRTRAHAQSVLPCNCADCKTTRD